MTNPNTGKVVKSGEVSGAKSAQQSSAKSPVSGAINYFKNVFSSIKPGGAPTTPTVGTPGAPRIQ